MFSAVFVLAWLTTLWYGIANGGFMIAEELPEEQIQQMIDPETDIFFELAKRQHKKILDRVANLEERLFQIYQDVEDLKSKQL